MTKKERAIRTDISSVVCGETVEHEANTRTARDKLKLLIRIVMLAIHRVSTRSWMLKGHLYHERCILTYHQGCSAITQSTTDTDDELQAGYWSNPKLKILN